MSDFRQAFYTKEEAAGVLGVSVRQIQNYMQEGSLRKVYQGRRAWIPKEDVTRLYDRATKRTGFGAEEVEALKDRISKMEKEVEILKLGLGFGAKVKPRTNADLLLLRQKFLDLLANKSWSNRQISGIADDLISIQEAELHTLFENLGVNAWQPIFELSQRMLVYIEQHPEYPSAGLDVLEARLLRARERFLGLLTVTSKSPTKVATRAAQLRETLEALPPFDQLILNFIFAQK